MQAPTTGIPKVKRSTADVGIDGVIMDDVTPGQACIVGDIAAIVGRADAA